MKLKFSWIIPSICIFAYTVGAMDMVLDFNRAKTDRYMVVKRTILKHGAEQVVCATRKRIHKFTIIKACGIRVPIDDNLRVSEASYYAREGIKLIKIRNPGYWLLNHKGGRYLYFVLRNREWVQIGRKPFTYFYRAITTITIPLDLGRPNFYVKTVTMKDGSIAYAPKSMEIFIYMITLSGKHIWPDKGEMHNQFSLGIYRKNKGVETFNIQYKDEKDTRKWTCRKLVGGKWVRSNRCKGRGLFHSSPKFNIA